MSSDAKDPVTHRTVAVVGAGAACEKHLAVLTRLPRVRVTGLCDRDRQAAIRMAQRFPVETLYDDIDDMLHRSRPEVVHVLTPPGTHAELAIQALEAGAHVLVEKPMASTLAGADAMIAAARDGGVQLCVCHNFLFETGIQKAMELVGRGAVGRIVAVEIYWRILQSRFRRIRWIDDLKGGVFHEVAPHPVYLLCAFLRNLRVLSASVSETHSAFGPDELRVHVVAESGLGTLAISTSSHPHQIWVRIYGTRSTLILDLTTNTIVRLGAGRETRAHKFVRNLHHGLQLSLGTAANAVRYLGRRTTTGRERLIEAFYTSLERRTAPPVTAEQGRETVSVLEEIWDALGQ